MLEPVQNWEAHKENVLPVKRGRSVNVLGEKLSVVKSGAETDADNANHLNMFEDMISKAKIVHEAALAAESRGEPIPTVDPNQAPGLLEAYLLYFKWVRDTYPSSSDKALAVLEQATCDMKHSTTLKNDTRFVKLWIEYVSNPNIKCYFCHFVILSLLFRTCNRP